MLSIRGDVRGLEPEIPPQRKKEGQEEKKNYRIWSFLSVFFFLWFVVVFGVWFQERTERIREAGLQVLTELTINGN